MSEKFMYARFFGNEGARKAYLESIMGKEAAEVSMTENIITVGHVVILAILYDGERTMERLRGIKFHGFSIDVESLPQIDSQFMMRFWAERMHR